MKDLELEVKYYLSDVASVEKRIAELGGSLVQKRTHEINIRFDTEDLELSKGGKILRLRHDSAFHLTYKGPGRKENGVTARHEIEFTLDDFRAAREMILALGYQVQMIYEKFRTTYEWRGTHITLDEMPYGNFVEIEGTDTTMIQRVSQGLELDWDVRIFESYTVLFELMRKKLGLSFRDLIFENFAGMEISPENLNVRPADVHL